jgi:hypothetical protein
MRPRLPRKHIAGSVGACSLLTATAGPYGQPAYLQPDWARDEIMLCCNRLR